MPARRSPDSSTDPNRPVLCSAFVFAGLLLAAIGLAARAATAETTWPEREERFEKFIGFSSMVKGGVVTPHWMDDANRFWYAVEAPGDTAYFMVDCAAGTREQIPGPPEADAPADEAGGDEGVEGVDETPSPDGRWFIAVKDNNLWYRAADGDELIRLTTDGEEDFVWSADGVEWSSDGDRFAAQRYDARPVHKMPVVTWLGHEETVDWRPYTYAEGPSYQSSVYIVDLAAGKVLPVDTGNEADQSHVVLEWRSDGSELLFLHLDRGMKQLRLLGADAATGAVHTIVTERQDTFIEGLHLYFTYDSFHHALEDGEHFVWRSERDGWAHFYLYRYNGELVRRLTEGEWEATKVLAVDDKDGWIYFTAQADPKRPYDRHLYRVDMDGKRMKQLTDGAGLHNVTLAPALTGFVDNYSSVDTKPTSVVRGMDGGLKLTLAEADVSELEEIGWKPPEEFVVKSADGKTDIYGLMYKPHDFDPGRKYPVIEIIYAGSQMTAVPNRFVPREYGFFAQILAQLNFVTVVIDSRGTPGRGKAFQDVVYRSIGRDEIPDHTAALKQLAEDRPYMDMTRVGVHGKSWGGYFALRAMLQAPDVYHVGVASALVADLATTAYSPITPYMEYPDENPEGYDYANCLEWADKLEGKLLVTASTGDLNTPFAQTMKMVEAFIQADKPVDLMVFPDQHHWLQGESLDYFYRVLKDYFVEHLAPEGSG
jgi:dipeptidyl aminopeptidase/acylaminoacyl peptidase